MKINNKAAASLLSLVFTLPASSQEQVYHHLPVGISPNSGRVIFQSWEKQQNGASVAQLFSMKTDGSDLRPELQLGVSAGWPDYTRDGKKAVLFARVKSGQDAELLVLDLSDPNDLSSYEAVKRLTFGQDSDFFPAWSPDATEIVFYGHRGGDNGQLYLMNADGSNVRNMSNNDVHESDPTWSVHGEITFESHLAGNADVWVMNGDGTGRRNLTNHPSQDHFGDWSPDGEQIVFSSDRSGSENLYIMNRDGSELRQLTNSPEIDRWPTWSRDGNTIAFDRNTPAGSNVVTIRPDGTGEKQLTKAVSYHIK